MQHDLTRSDQTNLSGPECFLCSLHDAGDHARSRIGIVFEQHLTPKIVFSSLVLVNRDRLIFFDPDA